MPLLPAWVAGALLFVASHLVARVLVSLGVMAVAFVGLDAMLDQMESLFIQHYNNLPAALINIAAMMKLGVALNILLSAGAMRLTLAGLSEGSITKMFVGARSIE